MFDVFEMYINQKVAISTKELELIKAESVQKKLRKWQSILHEGEVWRSTCFISAGCCRLYRFGEDGTDHTLRFGVDNWWISDQESFNKARPSQYNIEALAASTVIMWSKEVWNQLMIEIPALKLFNEQLLANGYETSQQRIFSLISASAEERYLDFQQTYPNVFNKVPLHMVASYLGISRETLSRIRKEFTKKK